MNDSFCFIRGNDVSVKNMHIAFYDKSDSFSTKDTRRDRKLLLHKNEIAKIVNKPEIGIVCDSFHIALSGEGYDQLANMGDKIVHAHTANPVEREYPKKGDGHRYDLFIDNMKKAGYDLRVSVESFLSEDLEPRIRQSAQLFKTLL